MHLCDAIYESGEDGKIKDSDKSKFKRFINKTFPVVYTIPQPVITDYNKLFNKYLRMPLVQKNMTKNTYVRYLCCFMLIPILGL